MKTKNALAGRFGPAEFFLLAFSFFDEFKSALRFLFVLS